MNRRQWLHRLGQQAAWMAWTSLFASNARPVSATEGWRSAQPLFTLGVASGEPRPASVVLWTRLAPSPLEPDGGMPPRPVAVTWEVALDEQFKQVVRQGTVWTDQQRAHSVHVLADHLPSHQRLYYRFTAGGQRSPVGRTRTAPNVADRPDRLRLALTSCQHYEMGHFSVHREIARQDIDLVLFVGDYVYLYDVPPYMRVRRHPRAIGRTPDLHEYRIHHASYKLDPDLQQAHAQHPWLLMWDDQEIRNDYDGWQDPQNKLDVASFLALRQRAYRAYFEHLPVSPVREPQGSGMPMLGEYTWGQLARLLLLDTRQYRSAPLCTDPVRAPADGRLLWQCEAMQTPTPSVLGHTQEQWLGQRLRAGQTRWELVAQTTQVSPNTFHTPAGSLAYADGWDAYPAARQRLMDAFAAAPGHRVVCLGGDVHRHVAARLRRQATGPHSPVVASEFVSSSITSKGVSELLNDWIRAGNPDIVHCRSDQRGYALLDVTDHQVACTFKATPHPVLPDATLHDQARFVVRQDGQGPVPA